MYVAVENAALLARFTETFGLPDVIGRFEDEMFGPYPFEGRSMFLRFRYEDSEWVPLANTDGSNDNRDAAISADDAEKLKCLEGAPRPPLPTDLTKRRQDEPFVFCGLLLTWIFFPELRRWEVAPLARDTRGGILGSNIF